MASRKRNHEEMADASTRPQPPSLLTQIRNTWYFACLMQYIQFFGGALKIDNELDIELLEEECLKPNSQRLADLGLTMLKWVSSHRGLTHDIFNEYTRRQYLAKAPHLNPFGEEEEANKFSDMDIFTKLKVLHQLSVWTFNNPDRMRERMEESRDVDQAGWRIETYGHDRDGRLYYLLDDNRLYRFTEPSSRKQSVKKPKPKAKPKSRPKKAGNRTSKRQKLTNGESSDVEEAGDSDEDDGVEADTDPDNRLGGGKWECLCVTMNDFRDIIDRFRKSKNADEKEMAMGLQEDVLPELEKAEESKARKEAKRMKELENVSRLATAKRSSRIADKQEKEKQEAEARAIELKHQQDLEMAHREQERQFKAERDRESRMMTREQRIKDREMRRILHEEDIANLEARSQSVDSNDARISERNRKTMLEKKQKDLEALKQEESDDWDFDCSICGVHGKNIDDGTHSIACDKCGVWQHSACNNITPQQAEKDDFKFVCERCSKPKTGIKLKLSGYPSPSAAAMNGVNVGHSHNSMQEAKAPSSAMANIPPIGTFKPPTASSARPPSSNGYIPVQPNGSYPNPRTHNTQQSVQHGYQYPQFQSTSQSSLHGSVLSHQVPQQYGRPSSASSSQAHPTSAQSPSRFMNDPAPSQPFLNGNSTTHSRPTPSLSATQGNTDVHFSPAAQPTPLSPSRHSNPLNLANSPGAAQAYSPSSNRPAHSAVSPTKHSSPPQPASQMSSFSSTNLSPIPPANPQFSLNAQSPMKQNAAAAPFQGSSFPSPGQATVFSSAPTLSPSVNAHGVNNSPPIKKMTPTKSSSASMLTTTANAMMPHETSKGI